METQDQDDKAKIQDLQSKIDYLSFVSNHVIFNDYLFKEVDSMSKKIDFLVQQNANISKKLDEKSNLPNVPELDNAKE